MTKKKQGIKTITILGATGSIGQSTLRVLEQLQDPYQLHALTASSNVDELITLSLKHQPRCAVIADATLFERLREGLSGSNITPMGGPSALLEVATEPVDWVMAAIVGAAGIGPTFAAIRHSKVVALANKESLVCAGKFMMDEAKNCGTRFIPVDSEHSAIFQILEERHQSHIQTLTITASGGPFRQSSKDEMYQATLKEALNHPVWKMGNKITIDSATMMNKGLEIIEAHYLFGIAPEAIEVLVHPESIVHGLLTFDDGAVVAQMGMPDMCMPISYALSWPDRMAISHEPLDLAACGALHFANVDSDRFPAVNVARQVLTEGGTAPIIFNTSNEVAVKWFLDEKISFMQIIETIEHMLSDMTIQQLESLPMIQEVITEVEQKTQDYLWQKVRKTPSFSAVFG